MSVVLDTPCPLEIVRKVSKDSCYYDMSGDLSATTNVGDCSRLSPTVPHHSRKSSASDSAFYEDEPTEDVEMSKDSIFKSNSYHHNEATSSVSNVVMDKLTLLENRLKQMEILLNKEHEERQKLAQKVSKLEKENLELKSTRTAAVSQLQTFSEKFFAMKEPSVTKKDSMSSPGFSPLNSPRSSHLELRRVGSSSTISSRGSRQSSYKSRSRPTSGISL